MADPTLYSRRPFGDATSDEYTAAMDAHLAQQALAEGGMPAPGGLPPTSTGITVPYEAPAAPAAEVAPEEQGFEPATPALGATEAFNIVQEAAGQGSQFTPAALRAQRELKLREGNVESTLHRMGDRSQLQGMNQEAQHLEVASELAKHGDAIKALGDAQAAADEQQAKDVESRTKAIESGRKQLLDASDKLDPSRLIGPSGKRVMFIVASALGALGQSLIGGRNNAVDMVNAAMDRDFEGQQARLKGKRENLSIMEQQLQDLRAKGVDDRAARAAVKSSLMEIMGNYVDKMKERGLSAEARAAGENLRDQFYMQADQWKMQALAATAKQTVKHGKTQAELLKESLALQKQVNDVRAQETELNTKLNPQAKVTDAAMERQTKLSDRVANVDRALMNIDQLIEAVRNDNVGPWNANINTSILRSKAGDDFDTVRKSIEDATSRGYGGPVTESDRKIAHDRWGAMRFTREGLLNHLTKMRELTLQDRAGITSGKPRADVAAVQANTTKPAAPKKTVADVKAALERK